VRLQLPAARLDGNDTAHFEAVTPLVAGALIQEVVHVRQGDAADAERTRQVSWRARFAAEDDISSEEWLLGYYDRWAEIEGHAALKWTPIWDI
jgi:hypothetical protein